MDLILLVLTLFGILYVIKNFDKIPNLLPKIAGLLSRTISNFLKMTKKIIYIIIPIAIIVACFYYCRNVYADYQYSNNVKKYQKYCEKEDFESAHKLLDELHTEYIKAISNVDSEESFQSMERIQTNYLTALEYIYSKEGIMLLANNDEASSNRVIFLIKEIPIDGNRPIQGNNDIDTDNYQDRTMCLAYKRAIDVYNKLCDKFLDLAINQGNEYLAEAILNNYKEDISVNQHFIGMDVAIESTSKDLAVKKYQEIFITKRLNDALLASDINLIKKLTQKDIPLNDSGIVTQLAALRNDDISNAIISVLIKHPILGEPLSKGIHSTRWGLPDSFREYEKGVIEYNKLCNQILEIAINELNSYLAQKVISAYKQNVECTSGSGWRAYKTAIKAPDGSGVTVESGEAYIWYTETDKKAAQKRYNTAVKQGTFKLK